MRSPLSFRPLSLTLQLSISFQNCAIHPSLPSFPTRRSSDLFLGTCARDLLLLEKYRDFRKMNDIFVIKNRKGTIHKAPISRRSEEHTSELQSRGHLVCRLLLE